MYPERPSNTICVRQLALVLAGLVFLQFRWLGYSLSTPVIVIVIVALAEELPALLTLLVTSLLGLAVSSLEMTVSLNPNRGNPVSIIARMITKNDLFTSTPS